MYPALAVLDELVELARSPGGPGLEVLWVGSQGGMEADLVSRANLPYEAIPAAGVHGVGLRALPGNLLRLGRGLRASQGLLRRYRPQVLFFTGGYVAVPVGLAARLPGAGKPRPRTLLYVPDIEPGLALKTLARLSDRIAVSESESQAYFPSSARVERSGYPVRSSLRLWEAEAARQALDLDRDLPVLMVSGGSSGARSINRALMGILPQVLAFAQVVHISGRLDWSEVEAFRAGLQLEDGLLARYHAYPYLHERMGAAYSVADLVVTRAGASSLGELPAFGLPAILVPYPHAWRYQQVNAQFLASRQAAVVLQDADLGEQLLPTLQDLLGDGVRLERMQAAMRALANPHAARRIAEMILQLSAEYGGHS